MSGKTLTRADLAEAVFQKVGLPRNESAEIVELVLREIIASLERGDTVKLSSFGSFGIRDKEQRIGRNPKTGQEVPITPRRVLVFRASNIMKQRINDALSRRRRRNKLTGAALDAGEEDGWTRRLRRFAQSARLPKSLRFRSMCCASGRPSSHNSSP